MLSLVEGTVRFTRDLPQVNEVNPRRKFAHHGDQIVVGPRSVRANTERQPVSGHITAVEDFPSVRSGRDDVRQAKKGERGIVGMNSQSNSEFFGNRSNFAEEGDQVCAELRWLDSLILRQHWTNGFSLVPALSSRQSRNNRRLQILPTGLGHSLKSRSGKRYLGRSVILLRVPSFQDENVIDREVDHVEAQRIAGRRKLPSQVGTSPVHHWHEVVADCFHARFGDRRQRVLPGIDVLLVGARAQLDGIVHRDTFDHRPFQSGSFDFCFSLEDFRQRPGLASIHMVQGSHNTGRARLLYLLQSDRVVRSKPTPGFFHLDLTLLPTLAARSMPGEGESLIAELQHSAIKRKANPVINAAASEYKKNASAATSSSRAPLAERRVFPQTRVYAPSRGRSKPNHYCFSVPKKIGP